jgi:16S rRNA U1498 N3-methylase RsmE
VELEADGLWFWQAERSQFPVPSDAKDTWHASLVAGAKQCRNPWLPELRTLPVIEVRDKDGSYTALILKIYERTAS